MLPCRVLHTHHDCCGYASSRRSSYTDRPWVLQVSTGGLTSSALGSAIIRVYKGMTDSVAAEKTTSGPRNALA